MDNTGNVFIIFIIKLNIKKLIVKTNKKKILNQLAAIAVLMLVGMTAYEILKQIISPDITIWQSHIVTILFSTVCATFVGYFIIRKQVKLSELLTKKNTESESLHRELEANIEKLKYALSEVKILSGLLPICSSCKKIRDEKGNWIRLEKYISERSDADFSHGLCLECAKKLYSELYRDQDEPISKI